MPEMIFNGPEGRLEGRYHHSKQSNAPVALLLHPHPQHGVSLAGSAPRYTTHVAPLLAALQHICSIEAVWCFLCH